MKFKTLVPNIFYADLKVGLNLFVNCLGFTITYNGLQSEEQPFCIVEKGPLKIHLVQNEAVAVKDRPEIMLETDNIEEVYDQIKATCPELLHPNSKEIKQQPWKVKEFALRDESEVCIVIQEWQHE